MPIFAGLRALWRSTVCTHRKTFARCPVFAVATLLAMLGGGCAAIVPISSAIGAVNPSANLQVYNTTELRLQQKNFVVVKPNVVGQSKGFALLGLITMVPARFEPAMTQLTAKADLRPGTARALSNLIWEKDSNYYILFSRPRTTVRADVIEFVTETNSPASGKLQTRTERE